MKFDHASAQLTGVQLLTVLQGRIIQEVRVPGMFRDLR